MRPPRTRRGPSGPNTSPVFWPADLQEELLRRVSALEALGYAKADAYNRAVAQLDPTRPAERRRA